MQFRRHWCLLKLFVDFVLPGEVNLGYEYGNAWWSICTILKSHIWLCMVENLWCLMIRKKKHKIYVALKLWQRWQCGFQSIKDFVEFILLQFIKIHVIVFNCIMSFAYAHNCVQTTEGMIFKNALIRTSLYSSYEAN